MDQISPVHRLGSRARIMLTSVFGPYAVDDGYGSRVINPMELYHNQVTEECPSPGIGGAGTGSKKGESGSEGYLRTSGCTG